MTRRDPLVLDRRLEPLDLAWLREDLEVERAWRQVRRRPTPSDWLANPWAHVLLVAALIVFAWLVFGRN